MGALSSWNGFKRVCCPRSVRQRTRARAAGPEEGTRLDVVLPRLLQEESDPFVVLELVQQDQLHACVDTLSGGEKPDFEANRKAHLRA